MEVTKKYRSKSFIISCGLYCFLIVSYLLMSCESGSQLNPVSVGEFSAFVKATGYITEAEEYGWSILQEDVYNFRVEDGLNWRIPNRIDSAQNNFPVTQVSYNDAVAYCECKYLHFQNLKYRIPI